MTKIVISKAIEFPENWVTAKMYDTGLIVSGGTPDTSIDEYWQGDILWCTPTDITSLKGTKYINNTTRRISESGLKHSSANILPARSLIICTRATIGDCAINTIPLTTNQGFKAIIPNENWSIEFLYYLTLNLKPELIKLSSGSTFLELSKKAFENITIYQPPFEEQKRIATILSTIDEKIDIINFQKLENEKLKEGLMQQLLTKGIGHSNFKNSELGEMPDTWQLVPIYELRNKADRYSFTGGPFGSDLKSEHYTTKGVRLIQLQHIGEGRFIDKNPTFISREKADELLSCNIFPNEIILAKMAPVARCCRVPNSADRFVMSSDGIRLSVDEKRFDSEFIFQALNSKYFRREAESKSTGTTRSRIGLNDLKKILIAVPPSLEEQRGISNILKLVDDKIDLLITKKRIYQELKVGMMQQLLSGKIRVNNQQQSAVA